MVINFACKKEVEKKIEKATDSVVEKTQTAVETTEVILDSRLKTATDTREIIENEIKKISVQFDARSTKKVIEGSVTGREIRDYLFNIKEGKHLKFTLVTASGRTPLF